MVVDMSLTLSSLLLHLFNNNLVICTTVSKEYSLSRRCVKKVLTMIIRAASGTIFMAVCSVANVLLSRYRKFRSATFGELSAKCINCRLMRCRLDVY